MRENYLPTLGRHEGNHPMVVFLDERGEIADDEAGDVEAPTGYFRRFGKWLIRDDSNGFCYGHKYPNVAQAVKAFDILDRMYSEWGREEDDED
jgi:hypothetical protein